MNDLPLTIIILTNRNDSRFEAALKSAQIAADVIVADYQSGNDWKHLLRKYDFRVNSYGHKLRSFAKARNNELSDSKTEWVLFLDSDEVLDPSSYKEIEDIITNDFFDGVTIKRQDYFYGKPLKHGEAGNMTLLRMFKKDLGTFTGRVHEVAKVKGRAGDSDIKITHFSHASISEFLDTITGYSQIIGKNSRDNKKIIILKMLLFPDLKFFQNYILKLGFLDGWRGLVYASMMSFHSFFVRVFAYETQTDEKH